MLKWKNICWIALLAFGCKKQFTPTGLVSTNNNYLVIEGTVNSGDSTIIRLTRTKKIDTGSTFSMETGAQVNVENDAGSSYPLQEVAKGTYSAAPLSLDISRKYRVRIKTTDNKSYLSDFVVVKNAPPIDSVGFIAQNNGVQIYVNSHDDTKATQYYRWDYSEAWQFHSNYFSAYSGSAPRLQKSDFIYNCYANSTSDNVIIASSIKLNKDVISQSPITLVPASAEKLETKYSILVKEYALTADAYAFWEYLQKNTEQLGSIFDAQPSETQTNYHCITNPAELAIGYLSAGTVTSKRIFITRNQLPAAYIPKYPYACQLDTEYYFNPQLGQPQLDNANYTAVDGLFFSIFPPNGIPSAITYSTRDCVDCTLRGSLNPPAFWQ